jgi:hypothetical protein
MRHSILFACALALGGGAQAQTAAMVTLQTRVSAGPQTLDLRPETPAALADRQLPSGAVIVMANPYVPVDRRFIDTAWAMACHPDGGLVLYARTRRYAPEGARKGNEYVDNGYGLWRVETDGRVRPLAVRQVRGPLAAGHGLCGVPSERAELHGHSNFDGSLAVEPGGHVLVADAFKNVVLRYRSDGGVEHVAGGGADICSRYEFDSGKSGYRDGPGSQALIGGHLTLAVGPRGEIVLAEGYGSNGGGTGNCSLRSIAADGQVGTVHGTGKCPTLDVRAAEGYRMIGFEGVKFDAQGRLLLYAVDRARREGNGPDVIYTKVHRLEGGREQLLGRTGHGARFDPIGRFEAFGTAPDGTPIAFNSGHYSEPGFVMVENRPQFRYWWRGASARSGASFNAYQAPVDGPRGQAVVNRVKDFCTGSDGQVYVLHDRAVRRIDPRTGDVVTWLH